MIDDGDDHDDWWWWSLCSRWLLTTFFFHRKTASWPPSPGGFWPTIFFSLVIYGQRSLLVSIFPIDVKVGWTLYFVKKIFSPHCLKNDIFTVYFLICAASQLRISKKFSHRDHMEFARLIEFAGVDKELRCRLYWDCQWWVEWSKCLQWCYNDCDWRSGWRWWDYNEDENLNLTLRENVFTVLAPTDEAFAGIWFWETRIIKIAIAHCHYPLSVITQSLLNLKKK